MRISFSPQRHDDATLLLEKVSDDQLSIDGEVFNFATLPDGGTIPAGEVPCEWIFGPVERVDGEVRLTLTLPHGPSPSPAVAFPEAITVTDDGPIAVPSDQPEEESVDVEP